MTKDNERQILKKYQEDKAFLKDQKLEYLTRRKRQLQRILLRANLEKDMIDNELRNRLS